MASPIYFDSRQLSDGAFVGPGRITCATLMSTAQLGSTHDREQLYFGTTDGVYASELDASTLSWGEPKKVLALANVAQIVIMPDHPFLMVMTSVSTVPNLGGGDVFTYPLEALDEQDPAAGLEAQGLIDTNKLFFQVGYLGGKAKLCVVEYKTLPDQPTFTIFKFWIRSTFRAVSRAARRGRPVRYLQLQSECLFPGKCTSVHFFEANMIVGTATSGFMVMDFERFDHPSVLNPADASLYFILGRRTSPMPTPLSVSWIEDECLLCYDGQFHRGSALRLQQADYDRSGLQNSPSLSITMGGDRGRRK
jgi:hypothetical protein